MTKKTVLLITVWLLFGSWFSLYGDGFIVVPGDPRIFPPPHPHPLPIPPPIPPLPPFPLEVKYHRVNVDINDRVALTSVDQEFYNPTNHRLEGYYLFPLPAGAVMNKFSMYVDGKEMEAELLDAQKARKIYENIVRKRRDPALLEYMDRGMFKVRIFPIEPRSGKRVKVSYHQVLPRSNAVTEYIYPLNTEKFSAKPLNDVAIHLDIKTPDPLKHIYSPTHRTHILRKGQHHARISFEEKNTRPDTDFKLYFGTDNSELGFSLLSYKKEKTGEGYFLLSLSPDQGGHDSTNESTIVKKDIAFVLDVSGSMAGEKLAQAKKALLFCIENLNPGDRFEILRFSTEAEGLFRRYAEVTTANRARAREFVGQLRAIGGTNIDEALSMALEMTKENSGKNITDSGRPSLVVFITDGKPTIGETDENRLIQKIKDSGVSGTRIFTFGIGNDLNTHLLDKITRITRAHRTYIATGEDIEIKISDFYTKVQSPVLTDLHLEFGKGIRVSKTYPRDLPDLFKGTSLLLLGRYTGKGDADILLSGKVGAQIRRFRFRGAGAFKAAGDRDSEKNDFIPPLWAARRVGYLLDQVRLNGENRELIEEITHLARTHGIITPYTSYLIVEDEQNRLRHRLIEGEDQTLAPIAHRDKAFSDRNREEFSALKSKSGAPSVRASKELRQLNEADNVARIEPGQSRMHYKDFKGKTQNLTAQVKHIRGRAFYNTGKYWVDSRIQGQPAARRTVRRIQFAGDDYFKLLEKQPAAAQFLALGKNLRFLLDGILYEIYE